MPTGAYKVNIRDLVGIQVGDALRDFTYSPILVWHFMLCKGGNSHLASN